MTSRGFGNSTRRQHHVWRSYLDAWTTGGKLFCLQDGRIFQAPSRNVAVERDFYKLQILTDADVYGTRLLVKDSPAHTKPVLEDFLHMFGAPGRLKSASPFTGDAGVQAIIDRQIINAEENYHARLEGGIKPIFDAIRRKDLSFYDDPLLLWPVHPLPQPPKLPHQRGAREGAGADDGAARLQP